MGAAFATPATLGSLALSDIVGAIAAGPAAEFRLAILSSVSPFCTV